MIKYLFLDFDNTILDFTKAESIAIRKTMRAYGLEPTDELARRYSAINDWHWKALERGELTKPEVVTRRFAVFFGEQGIDVDEKAVAKTYETFLSQGHWFLPGAEKAVKEELFGKYRLFLASNGTPVVQHGRMTSAGLYPYFEQSFISEEIGHSKPHPAMIHKAMADAGVTDPRQAVVFGDSITADIAAARNAGVDSILYTNGADAPDGHGADYVAHNFEEALRLILG